MQTQAKAAALQALQQQRSKRTLTHFNLRLLCKAHSVNAKQHCTRIGGTHSIVHSLTQAQANTLYAACAQHANALQLLQYAHANNFSAFYYMQANSLYAVAISVC